MEKAGASAKETRCLWGVFFLFKAEALWGGPQASVRNMALLSDRPGFKVSSTPCYLKDLVHVIINKNSWLLMLAGYCVKHFT